MSADRSCALSCSEQSGKKIPMIGSGFKIDFMKHQIAEMIANANCAAKILVGSAPGGDPGGTDLACVLLDLIAAETPSDSAIAAPDRGPGSAPRSAVIPALVAVLAAMLALFLAAVSLALAALAARRRSEGVVTGYIS